MHTWNGLRNARSRAGRAAYRSGAMSAYHRLRNARNLTVLMFHRVLSRDSRRFLAADPNYVLPSDVFASALSFVGRHYNVISLRQLAMAVATTAALPSHPLLITFDDGWADTLDCAAPILKFLALPAVCFITSDALDDPASNWWQELFSFAWRNALIDEASILKEWTEAGFPALPMSSDRDQSPFLRSLAMMQDLSSVQRSKLLQGGTAALAPIAGREMLAADRLPALVDAGIEVGGHGTTHIPMNMCRDVNAELSTCRRRLETILGQSGQMVSAMSFPHGRYNRQAVHAARKAGYRFLFTSEPSLTPLINGRPAGGLYGRIEIAAADITDGAGVFEPERMAAKLFTAPSVRSSI
jgi:peptidoglycan/xylan/chitin deacetylase (PgdA/CDA1 family)